MGHMKKLTPKLSGFSGKSLFFRSDGSFEESTSETLPEGFSFGVSASESGVITSPAGSFIIFVSEESGYFYVYIVRGDIGYTGTQFLRFNHPDEVIDDEQIYLPDRRIFYYSFTQNTVFTRDRDDLSLVHFINFKTGESRTKAIPIDGDIRRVMGSTEDGDTSYFLYADVDSTFAYDSYRFYLLAVNHLDESLDVNTFLNPLIPPSVLSNISSSSIFDFGVHINDSGVYVSLSGAQVIKFDRDINYLYHWDDFPVSFLSGGVNSFPEFSYSMDLDGEGGIYLPYYSYRDDNVYEVGLLKLIDNGSSISLSENTVVDSFVGASASGLGFTELYSSDISGQNIYLQGYLWDNYENPGMTYEMGLYLASVNTETMEVNWGRKYYASQMPEVENEFWSYKVRVVGSRVYVATETSGGSEGRLHVYDAETGDYIESFIPWEDYIII